MKNIFKALVFGIVITLVSACSLHKSNAITEETLKIDGTSEKTLNTSIKKIEDGLEATKKELFDDLILGVFFMAMSEAKENGTPERELIFAVLAKLDGKTADDIFAMKDEIEAFFYNKD